VGIIGNDNTFVTFEIVKKKSREDSYCNYIDHRLKKKEKIAI
jgi:hypothetical protein